MTPPSGRRYAVVVDFGSTFTKVWIVDLAEGRLLASEARPTTACDLRGGLHEALTAAGGDEFMPHATVIGCSSAGGGLRVAVAGLEEDLTVRAGRYAAMSAGGVVVLTLSGGLDVSRLAAAQVDLVVLTGGLDGGDEECLLGSAEQLAASKLRPVVVIAGNAAIADRAARSLSDSGFAVSISPNVMPAPGMLDVAPARARIRDAFIRHVIGGRQAADCDELRRIVRMATPDAVLLGTELLAGVLDRDLVVIDVGGATTDVHSHVRKPMARQGSRVRLEPELAASRTVEADLGVWVNAEHLVDAAARENLIPSNRAEQMTALLPRRFTPADEARWDDLELAHWASRVAVRRHAGRVRTRATRDGVIVESEGKDLRSVAAVIGTGGVFRRADRQCAHAVLRSAVCDDHARDRRLMPAAIAPVVDVDYVLAAAGLVSTEDAAAAARLLGTSIGQPETARA